VEKGEKLGQQQLSLFIGAVENLQLCLTFLLKPLRKAKDNLCKSGRGIISLQPCYLQLVALLLRNLKKSSVKGGQVK
jgi:hypothetical protein